MPEHIRALIVILFLSTVVFTFAKAPSCQIITCTDFTRRRNLWYGITLIAFFAYSFWIYAFLMVILLANANGRESNKIALFFILLFAVPVSYIQVPGMGIINYLFTLSHQRLLVLAILLPVFITLSRNNDTLRFGRLFPDKIIIAYIVLTLSLSLRETSVTDTFRQVAYQFTDIFLPYYVISRSLKDIYSFREALLSFVIAVMLMAIIGVFEAAKHWLLYKSLLLNLDMNQAMTIYLGRAGILRAVASAGQPIALGYVMAVGIGFYLFLQQAITTKVHRRLGILLLIGGLLAPISRGPWLGAVIIVFSFIATGQNAFRRLFIFSLGALVSFSLISVIPGGDKAINLIPFIGETEKSNITYRDKLLENSAVVIMRHPWLGSVNYMDNSEMEELRQGQGLIDVVNTYIRIALDSGFVGLTLFLGFFLVILKGIYSSFKSLPDDQEELRLLGRSLFATLFGILVIIFTVSSITIIPWVYWCVAGLGVAYIQLAKPQSINQYQ